MQIDGIQTNVIFKRAGFFRGKLQGIFSRETVAQPGDNPNFTLAIDGTA